MALQEQRVIDKIELNGDGTITLRRKDFAVVGSTEVFIGYHNRKITPDDDMSREITEAEWWLTDEVKQIASEYWTSEVIERWEASKENVLNQ